VHGAQATDRADGQACRSSIEHISNIDKSLHTEVVANIVGSTLNTLQNNGPSAVPWQQTELALHLVYTFGEMSKSKRIPSAKVRLQLMTDNTRAAFFELPPELLAQRDRSRKDSFSGKSQDDNMSSGRNTPIEGTNGGPASNKAEVNYQQFPLTTLGQLLTLCMESGVSSYPHPSVTLQYFEICVRYVEFWKARTGSIQPAFEAMLDTRGIHHQDEHVRRRCFYLFWKFVKECRPELDPEVVPPILQSMMVSRHRDWYSGVSMLTSRTQ
jgi:exportin-T